MTLAPDNAVPAGTETPAPPSFSPAAATLGAYLSVAAIADLMAVILLPSSAGFRGLRGAHLALGTLQLLGCGAIVAAVVIAWEKARARRKVWAWPFLLGGLAAVGAIVLPEDVGGLAEKIEDKYTALLVPVLVAGTAIAGTLLIALVRWLARRFTRIPAAVLGAGLAIANTVVLEHDYPGIHLVTALIAGAALAHAIAGARLPGALGSKGARTGALAVAAIGVVSVILPIPNGVMSDMLRDTGAVVAPFTSRFHGADVRTATLPPSMRPWFSPRAQAPDVKPKGPRVLPEDAVVVLLTVDALRADVILSGEHDKALPTFAAMKRSGVVFTKARAPGSQTVPVITGLFTGKYYSQLYWSGGKAKHAWPEEDESVRFPEILRDAGVVTVTMPTLPEVMSTHGVARGFVEDRPITKRPKGEPSPLAQTVMERIRARLSGVGADNRPYFVYAHFVDAHAPYTRGGTDCQPFDCYVREVALVDEAIGEIRKLLQSEALAKRAVLIVSADHGEAFGEHGQRFHATTLYEELLRVPLIVEGPMFPAHQVDAPVSLLDLGPTLLELWGKEAPGAFMGESLVRLLRGEPDKLTRPIAADSGRLMQALIFDDNVKIIRNNRNHTVEMYDLNADPGETHSVYETSPDAAERLAAINTLFEANAFKQKGYSPPFRK